MGVVVVFALGAQILVYLGGLLVVLLVQTARGTSVSYAEIGTSVKFILPVQSVWWVLVSWVVYRIVRARDPRPFWVAIAWLRPERPAIFYLIGGMLLALSVAGLAALLPMERRKLPIEELFKDPTSAFLLAGFGVLIAPVVEEMLFRGFFFPVIARANGTGAGVMGTAALFSLVHAQQYGGAWQNLLLLGYVGVVFGVVRAVTGSLVPCVLLHAGYNFTLFAGLYAGTRGFQQFNF
jgi:membrane protease YdiL (CAAX protease family)